MSHLSSNSLRQNKKVQLATVFIDLALLILGICLLVWADKVTSFISIAFGTLFVVYSLYLLIAHLRTKPEERSSVILLPVVALLIAGGFLILKHDFIKELISFVVGIFLIIKSLIGIQDAINSKPYFTRFITPLALSSIGLLCGILCIAGKLIIPNLLFQILGIMLAVFGVVDLVAGLFMRRAHKSANQSSSQSPNTIEAEIIDKPKR
ncbi:DUF308 domain-containing protein [Candidatus Saccharibacteria bacterium]|nr:DUF308 domain-containing protein [Candidatus Saccharibacteria bacterium]